VSSRYPVPDKLDELILLIGDRMLNRLTDNQPRA
jgi:hypothetical protein